MFTPQNFSGNQALTQMFLSRQDEHVSFISPCLHFQVVQGFKRRYFHHDFTFSATKLLLQPNGVQWNIYTYMGCTWIPQPVLLKYRNPHLHIWFFFFFFFSLYTTSSEFSCVALLDEVSHLEALPEAASLQGAPIRSSREESTSAVVPDKSSLSRWLLPPSSFLQTVISLRASGIILALSDAAAPPFVGQRHIANWKIVKLQWRQYYTQRLLQKLISLFIEEIIVLKVLLSWSVPILHSKLYGTNFFQWVVGLWNDFNLIKMVKQWRQ